MPNRPSDRPFGGLEDHLQQAAWSKLNQARGEFLAHMDREGQADTERAWEDALLAKADVIRGERVRANAEAIGRMVREGYAAEAETFRAMLGDRVKAKGGSVEKIA